MSDAPVIMWFRSDLRLTDNTAFNAALRSGARVIPLFVLDPAILYGQRTGAPRVAFLLKALAALDESLQKYGSMLIVLQGNPVVEIPGFIAHTGATALYLNRDTSPYALRRDEAVRAAVTVPVYSMDDALLVPPGGVLKTDGTPYTVFTPFKRQWLTIPKKMAVIARLESNQFAGIADMPGLGSYTLASLGLASTIPTPAASEQVAQQRLADFVAGPIYGYAEGRNRLMADPVLDTEPGPSFLSPYLHLGLLSIREAYWAAMQAYEEAPDEAARQSVTIWISELAWREFYRHILFHFHHVSTGNFRPQYDSLEWRHAPDDLRAWQAGQTGYPVVDAAMRQLQQTGWMPNRARMIVASFLTKHLLIDWREGEHHFMRWLIDGDLAANNGGWQWSAGTGTDAQPYFRIFNPVTQSQKFDPDGAYIRRWVPELRTVPAPAIHVPWTMTQPPVDYPPPIVDHRFARQRALDVYGMVKKQD